MSILFTGFCKLITLIKLCALSTAKGMNVIIMENKNYKFLKEWSVKRKRGKLLYILINNFTVALVVLILYIFFILLAFGINRLTNKTFLVKTFCQITLLFIPITLCSLRQWKKYEQKYIELTEKLKFIET